MENKLARLFDYQKYEPNSKLAAIINDVESRYPSDIEVLSDDELGMLNAAGTVDTFLKNTEKKAAIVRDRESKNEKQAKLSKNGIR
jgi:hypothetical protein